MPSLVFVWENNTAGHRCDPGQEWPGHASMAIGCDFSQEGYVSWWPGTSKSFGVGTMIASSLLPRGLFFKGGASGGFPYDIISEGYLPDHVVYLKTTQSQEAAMRSEWKSTRDGWFGSGTPRIFRHAYNPLKMNCSTVVSRVLIKAGCKTKKWTANVNWFWTPGDVFRLAIKSQGTEARIAKWSAVVEHFITHSFPSTNFFTTILTEINKNRVENSQRPLDALMARTGKLCTSGARCRFDPDASYFWADDKKLKGVF